MSISFSEVPLNARVPGVYIEIDNSLSNSAEQQQKVLFIGNADQSAQTKANQVMLCLDDVKASELFGASDAVDALGLYKKQDKSLPTYITTASQDGIDAALAALGDEQYHHIICTLNDDVSVKLLVEFLESRYKALSQIPSIAYIAKKGIHAELITFAEKFNCPMLSIIGFVGFEDAKGAPLSDASIVGGWAGQIAPSLANDPCRPLQTLKINGLYSDSVTSFTWEERNLLLHEGVGTYTLTSTNEVQVERPVTTYTENAASVEDDSYLDVMTVATAMFYREKQRSRILSKYPRHKLAEDGTRFAPGQAIVTPSMIKSELLALYDELEFRGIVQDTSGYKKSIIVTLDATNKSRINYQDSPQFVNGLIITAGKIQFRK